MDIDYFKDHLFDLINESDLLDVQDIICFDKENRMLVKVADGTVFSVQVRKERTGHPLS